MVSQDLKLAQACDHVSARFAQKKCDFMAVSEVNKVSF